MASVRTSPAAVSSVTTVVGSVIGRVPVSSSAVTTQIVFDPLMACARSAWRTMKPASARGSVEGNTRLALAWGRPRGSSVQDRRTVSSTHVEVVQLLGRGPARDLEDRAEVARALFPLGVDLDGGVAAGEPHQRSTASSTSMSVAAASSPSGSSGGRTSPQSMPRWRRPSFAFWL